MGGIWGAGSGFLGWGVLHGCKCIIYSSARSLHARGCGGPLSSFSTAYT